MTEEQQSETKEIPTGEEKGYITIEDFHKVEARVGTVRIAEPVPDADKLIRCEIDFGGEVPVQILSGIREWYPDPSVLIGKQILYCTNLEPRKIRGHYSHGMLMAVSNKEGKPIFLVPHEEVPAGAQVH